MARYMAQREPIMSEPTDPQSPAPGAPSSVADKPRRAQRRQHRSKPLPPYHVVLLDDDDHSYTYVIEMMYELFNYPIEKGMRIAEQVDELGRAIVCTTHRELAELKRDQIHAYGADRRVATCKGSMTAIIEPAK